MRAFRSGDEKEIVHLFNDVYSAHGGFVPRTEEYWRWSCLLRPDVRQDGILLVCDEETKKIHGYAVAGLNGNVWEFCAGGDREQVASILLQEVAKYLETADASSININSPDDVVLKRTFSREGFTQVPLERMFVSTLSPRALLSTLVAGKEVKLDEEIALELQSAPAGVEKNVSIRIHGGEIDVVNGLSRSATIVVNSGFLTFLSVLFGVSGVHWAFLTGKIRVKPFWKIGKVIKLLDTARLRASWFWPMGDYG